MMPPSPIPPTLAGPMPRRSSTFSLSRCPSHRMGCTSSSPEDPRSASEKSRYFVIDEDVQWRNAEGRGRSSGAEDLPDGTTVKRFVSPWSAGSRRLVTSLSGTARSRCDDWPTVPPRSRSRRSGGFPRSRPRRDTGGPRRPDRSDSARRSSRGRSRVPSSS